MQYNSEQYNSIEKAAYDLYVQRGRLDGEDVSDWLEAEKVILEKSSPVAGKVVQKRKITALKSGKKHSK